MHIRIALLPDKDTDRLVKERSALLSSQLPTHFTLDGQHIPHVTIVHIDCEEEQLENIKNIVQSIAQREKAISVEADSIQPDINDGTYIGVYFKEKQEIVALRDKVLASIKHIFNSATTFLDPHITITRLQNDSDTTKTFDSLKDFPQAKIALSTIAICDSQANGAVSEIYAIFALL
jgi:2'-5' RNA ligase